MVRLPLDELTNHLDVAKAHVQSWAQQTSKSASEQRKQHLATLQQSQASITELKEKQKLYEEQAKELQQRLRAEQAAEDDELGQLKAVQAQEAAIPPQLHSLQQLVDRETASLQHSEAELQQQAAEATSKLAALRVEVERFRSHLGLHFDYTQGSEQLRLVFTHINPADWSQPYCLSVRVLPDSDFEVTSCEPQLDSLQQLTSNLNATQNFSKFVRCVRQGFVQLT